MSHPRLAATWVRTQPARLCKYEDLHRPAHQAGTDITDGQIVQRLACVTTRHRCTRSRLESASKVFSLQRTEGRRSLRHSETPGHGPPSALFKYVDFLSGSGDRIVGRRAAAALQAAAAGVCCDCRPRFDPACAQPRHLGTQPRYLAPSVT